MGGGLSSEELNDFKHTVSVAIKVIYKDRLNEITNENKDFAEKYEEQFFEAARLYFLNNQVNISDDVQKEMAEAGGLEDYCEKYSKLQVTWMYQEIYKQITLQAENLVKHPNVDLYVDFGAISRYEYYPLDNRVFKEEIFNEQHHFDMKSVAPTNQKIKSFRPDEEIIPKLVQAYAQHLVQDEFMKDTFELHTFKLTDSIQQDVVTFLTSRAQLSPLSGKNGNLEDPQQWDNHLMESLLKDKLKKEEYQKAKQESWDLHNGFLNLQSLNTAQYVPHVDVKANFKELTTSMQNVLFQPMPVFNNLFKLQ